MSAEGLALVRLIEGYRAAQAIRVAARLGIADLLAAGPRGIADLARDAGADEDALYRLLRALASLGVFTEVAPRRFGPTTRSALLRRDDPESLVDFALLHGEPWHWDAWGQLLASVRTGAPTAAVARGPDGLDALANGPEGQVFHGALAGLTRHLAPLIRLDLGGAATIVDVGGGEGALLAAVLATHPAARGILVDRAPIIARARAALGAGPLADRITFAAGSFFEAVPRGDAYLLKFVLHDWDDARAAAILGRCRAAAAPGAHVIALEAVLPPGDVPHPGKLADLEMLVATPAGRERTAAEFAVVFAAAGLRLDEVRPTLGPLSLLVAPCDSPAPAPP